MWRDLRGRSGPNARAGRRVTEGWSEVKRSGWLNLPRAESQSPRPFDSAQGKLSRKKNAGRMGHPAGWVGVVANQAIDDIATQHAEIGTSKAPPSRKKREKDGAPSDKLRRGLLRRRRWLLRLWLLRRHYRIDVLSWRDIGNFWHVRHLTLYRV